jgi:hypothetical protein
MSKINLILRVKNMNDHLKDIDMGYFEHLYHAWSMAFALLLHGLFPFLLTDYASDKMCDHDAKNSPI